MADFPSTHPNLETNNVDGVDTVLAADVNTPNDELNYVITHLMRALPLGYYSNTETLAAAKTLVDSDKILQYLDAGGSARDVNLPAEADTNHMFIIVNTGGETLTVKDDTPATVTTILAGAIAILVSDGTTWKGDVINTAESIEDVVGAMFSGNTETGITVTYQDGDGTIDLVVSFAQVQDDTTPVLGGDLDVNDKDIHDIKQVDFEDVYDNGNQSGAFTVDWNNGNKQKVRMTGNITPSFTDPPGPCSLTLRLLGDGTARTPVIDTDADCEIVDNGDPGSYGSTDGEVVGIWSFDFDPNTTPKYVASGASIGAP